MSKFHISKDGVARKCQAKTVESCRAVKSGFDEHFETREQAQAAFEGSMSSHTVSTLKKNKASVNEKYLQVIAIKNNITGVQALKNLDEMNRFIRDRVLTPVEKKFVKDFVDGRIPQSIPSTLINDRMGMSLHSVSQDAGYFAKITKDFARNLKGKIVEDLDGKDPVVLDPLAGKGYFVKAMREQGVKTIGSDDKSWAKVQTDEHIEDLDAMESLRKHGNEITHLMMSWTPLYSNLDKRLYNTVRKDFPHITIINIGEDAGGCTGSEEFWDSIRQDENNGEVEINYDNCGYQTISGIHDFVTFVKPVK